MFGRSRITVLVGALLLSLLACGVPTSEEGSSAPGGGAPDAQQVADRLKEITTELEGLDAEERRARLIELAKEEGGAVTAYGSTNYDTSGPLLDLFEEKTGITTNFYRASSSDVLRRVIQEAEANRSAADVVFLNGSDMVVLANEGLLQPVDTPVAEQLIPSVVYDSWFGFYVNAFTVGWNTERVTEPPTSWEQVLTEYRGQLAMEAGDWDWFATLVQEYFVAEKGMSEDEAVDLFRQAARNTAAVVDGHTLMAQLLVAGEYDVAASLYTVNTRQLKAEGAPMEWEPPVQPLVLRPNGMAIHRHAQHPATALLFLEFMLTDGQEILPDFGRDPVNVNVEGGLPPEYETLAVPIDAMLEQREEWESLYDKVIREAGKEPITE